eukprot:s4139_g1.t1
MAISPSGSLSTSPERPLLSRLWFLDMPGDMCVRQKKAWPFDCGGCHNQYVNFCFSVLHEIAAMASKLRLLALLYYLAVAAFGVLVSVWISSVHRAPLPREDIERLAEFFPAPNRNFPSLWSKDALEISADPKAFDAEVLGSFSLALSDALGGTSVKVGRLRDEGPLGPCVHEASSTTACLEALEAEALSDTPLSASFELVLVKADSNALILGTGRRAFLWWSGRSVKDTAASTASLLKESWFRPVSFDGGASLFEITPGYVFSFFLLGDCASRISWDFFHAVLMPYLSRILGKLRILFDIEWNSQVVLCGSLGNSLEPSERGQKQAGNVVDVSLLQADFMRRTGEWPPDALTRDARWLPPLVRFVAFKPTESVQLVDEEGESRHSFAVQGFGAVAIAQCETGRSLCSQADRQSLDRSEGGLFQDFLDLTCRGFTSTEEADVRQAGARVLAVGAAKLLEMDRGEMAAARAPEPKELGQQLQLGVEELKELLSPSAEADAPRAAFQEEWKGESELRLTFVSQLGSESGGFVGGIQGQICLGEAVTADASYTVEKEGRTFAALPWKKKDDKEISMDMVKAFDDSWIDIPCGWIFCRTALWDFERIILPEVIGGHAWGTDMLLVRRGSKWPGWKTGIQGSSGAGRRLCSHVDWFEIDVSGRRCVFRGEDKVSRRHQKRTSDHDLLAVEQSLIVFAVGRVLLEKISQHEQIEVFKAFLRTTASCSLHLMFKVSIQALEGIRYAMLLMKLGNAQEYGMYLQYQTVRFSRHDAPSLMQKFEKPLETLGEASNSSSLSDCEARRVASGWISSVRSWLSLPADGSLATGGDASLELLVARPRIDGIAAWELQILARAAHAHFVQRTAETLRSLVELVDSLPDVVVREEIAAMAFQAVAKTRTSIDAASQGEVATALAESREALVLALTAIHDDSVVSQLYFSWEFKYAVYLPISMPILVPLLTACWRQVLAMFSSTKRLVKRG